MTLESSGESSATFTLGIGSVSIELRTDPIESILRTTELDAVVSSDDSLLSMGGGVSAAIAELAGPSVRDELAPLIPLPVGALAVTSGGELPVKYIIHAVTVDWGNNVLPTQRTIRQLMREILSRCEALRITRIAIPALATGAAGFPPEESARIIARALYQHALNPSVVEAVVLSIPGTSVRLAFARELAMPLLEEITLVKRRLADEDSLLETMSEGRESLHRGRAPRVQIEYKTTQTAPASERDLFRRLGEALSRKLGGKHPRGDEEITTEPGPAPPHDGPPKRTVAALAGDPSSRPLIGGRYVLLEEIGRGGMGVVLLSWDIVMRRVVAIKVLRPDTEDPESLRREAAAALELSHEGIVRLYHFEPARDLREGFLVMEYVSWPSGETPTPASAGCRFVPSSTLRYVSAMRLPTPMAVVFSIWISSPATSSWTLREKAPSWGTSVSPG